MSPDNPILHIEDREMMYVFSCFCTYVTLIEGKKLNTANVFLKFLKSRHLRFIFKRKFSIDSDYDAVKLFLKFDPSIYKSKYIMKYLNSACKNSILR